MIQGASRRKSLSIIIGLSTGYPRPAKNLIAGGSVLTSSVLAQWGKVEMLVQVIL